MLSCLNNVRLCLFGPSSGDYTESWSGGERCLHIKHCFIASYLLTCRIFVVVDFPTIFVCFTKYVVEELFIIQHFEHT